jgi:NRPS condensation-like uncharacterized protein
MYPGTSIGIVAGTLKIRGDIDYPLLKKAVDIYIERNDTLRLHFVEIDGEPKQYYSEPHPAATQILDFSSYGKDTLFAWDTERTKLPFDLIDSDLYEIIILKVSRSEAGIYIKMHHLISDGWSIVNTANDIFRIYTELVSGQYTAYEMPPPYCEFIKSEADYLNSDKFIKDKQYWRKVMSPVLK